MRQQPDTRALVLHFPSNALKLLVKKGYIYQFPTCLSNENTRYEERFCRIRFYASQIWQSLECGGTYAQLSAKVNLELLLITLFTEFDPQQINLISEEDKRRANDPSSPQLCRGTLCRKIIPGGSGRLRPVQPDLCFNSI